MHEQFKNDLLMTLASKTNFSANEIKMIITHFDIIAYDYEIKKKETALVVYNYQLPQLAQMFLVCKTIEGFSEGTLYNYTRHLNNFFFALQKAPEQITSNDIRVYLYKYQQERGITNRSLDKVRSCLASFYSWMHTEGYIEKNPMLAVNKIKYEKKPKKPCTQTDLEYLRMACNTPKQKAILEVLYSTGCRVSELTALKKEDVNWQEKSVHLFGKGKKHRVSFLNAKAEVALKEYLNSRKDDNEWLFVSDRKPYNQMHRSGIEKIIRQMTERASDNVNKNVTPHTMRRTLATTMVANNASIVSVQKILGHENINTTMTYVNASLDMAKAEHARTIV